MMTPAVSPRRTYVTDSERTDLLLKLGDALTANANLQHELTQLTTECSRLDQELTGLAATLRPIAHRRECLCVRGDDGLYAHPRCTAVHEEACVGVVRLERVDEGKTKETFEREIEFLKTADSAHVFPRGMVERIVKALGWLSNG